MNSTVTTGFTSNTTKNLIIDSGAVYSNYGEATEAIIGATSGGNEFNVKITMRQPKIDGIKSKYAKGLEIIEDYEITLKCNFLEMSEEVLKLALLAGVDTTTLTTEGYDVLTSKISISDTDYLNNVALVGTLNGYSKPVVILLKNVLALDGLQVKFEDAKDITCPLTLTAHFDPTAPTAVPYEIRFPQATA